MEFNYSPITFGTLRQMIVFFSVVFANVALDITFGIIDIFCLRTSLAKYANLIVSGRFHGLIYFFPFVRFGAGVYAQAILGHDLIDQLAVW
jgi:hypothetical protein